MPAKNVKVYSTTTCPYCVMEKQWLEKNNIPHNVVYVDMDHNEAKKMIQNTGQYGVPVTEVTLDDGKTQYVVGFNPQVLKDLIN